MPGDVGREALRTRLCSTHLAARPCSLTPLVDLVHIRYPKGHPLLGIVSVRSPSWSAAVLAPQSYHKGASADPLRRARPKRPTSAQTRSEEQACGLAKFRFMGFQVRNDATTPSQMESACCMPRQHSRSRPQSLTPHPSRPFPPVRLRCPTPSPRCSVSCSELASRAPPGPDAGGQRLLQQHP